MKERARNRDKERGIEKKIDRRTPGLRLRGPGGVTEREKEIQRERDRENETESARKREQEKERENARKKERDTEKEEEKRRGTKTEGNNTLTIVLFEQQA